jgi:hypothetical protein
MALRRPPTRIELKADDVDEYDKVRQEREVWVLFLESLSAFVSPAPVCWGGYAGYWVCACLQNTNNNTRQQADPAATCEFTFESSDI